LVILCHFNLLDNPQGAENSWNLQLISSGVYVERTGKMVESILRLSLCFSKEIRRSALESMELWGLTKEGSVSGLYFILVFSQFTDNISCTVYCSL